MVSLQPETQAPLDPTPIAPEQAALFACDDSALMAQYLAGFPPLQPSRVMTMQPPANREEMVYPGPPQARKYDSSPEDDRAGTGLGIQAQAHLMSTPVGPSTMPGPYPAQAGSPSFARHNAFVRLPPRYSTLQGFDVKDDPDGVDMQGRSTPFDLFSHQKTLPARRGPFKDTDLRARTARTRKMGSCIRCRMQRIRVSYLFFLCFFA